MSAPCSRSHDHLSQRAKVIVAGTNCLGGVTTWADRLRTALADHPRYDVQSLYVGREANSTADIAAPTLDQAYEILRNLAPAIILPNYLWPLFLLGLEPGIRCIGMCHADDVTEYYRPLSWYEPAIAKFITVSKECAQTLAQHVAFRRHDISTLPYGVTVPGELRRSYQTRPLRIIYAGRVVQSQKRVWDFVPLMEQLVRTNIPFIFDAIGAGCEFKRLKHFFRTRLPAADVRFHPRVPHASMSTHWLNHDIFVQVSEFEGTSVSMLEAMAHGVVPVVTAVNSGIDGVIRSHENGFVVPVGDMAAMAQVIAQLASDRALLENVGTAAYQSAGPYSMDQYVSKFVAVLDEVMSLSGKVDLGKRYGAFTPQHPLLLQHQQISKQRTQIEEKKRRLPRRLWNGTWFGWRRAHSKHAWGSDRNAA